MEVGHHTLQPDSPSGLFTSIPSDLVPRDVTDCSALPQDCLGRASDWCCYDYPPITSDGSCDHDSAILPDNVDIYEGFDVSQPSFQHVSEPNFVFTTPASADVAAINIYNECIDGTCSCVHYIGVEPCQLKPCRAAQFLFGDTRLTSVDDSEALFLWKGLVNGFAIVDDDCQASYTCENYDSILEPKAYTQMSELLDQEIKDHKVTIVEDAPNCVHSLGAVWKSNGSLRPITE